MSQRLAATAQAGQLCGWLRRYAPDGRCKICGGSLPVDRRFTHEACDQQVKLERPIGAGPVAQRHVLDDLAYQPLLEGVVAIDDPRYPSVDRWSRESQTALRAWTPRQSGIWVRGSVGSGKSTGLAGLALRLQRERVPALATSWRYLVDAMAARRKEGRAQEAVDALGQVDVLLLDDLLVETPREWERGLLFEVLDARLGARRPVIVTGNRALSQLPDVLVAQGQQVEDDAQAQRIMGRLHALIGQEVRCVYPGDRRTGRYDEALAATLAPLAPEVGR